jgi:hypothetical protein
MTPGLSHPHPQRPDAKCRPTGSDLQTIPITVWPGEPLVQEAPPRLRGPGSGPTCPSGCFSIEIARWHTQGQCYLSRPSGLTAPSSDLGSGLKELQAVWLQVCMTGQEVGPVAQMSMAVHIPPTSESSHPSSTVPVVAAFLRACSTWAGLMGRLRTGFKLWKLCSM